MIPHHHQRQASAIGNAEEVVGGIAQRVHQRDRVVRAGNAVVLAQVDPTGSQLLNAAARISRDIGARLLHRTTRRVAPTQDGVAFYERCQRVIADVEVSGIGSYFVNERTLVSIPVGKRSALAVPPQALKTVHGVDYVRLSNGGMDVAVITGAAFDDNGEKRVEILTGLRDGDRIVLP